MTFICNVNHTLDLFIVDIVVFFYRDNWHDKSSGHVHSIQQTDMTCCDSIIKKMVRFIGLLYIFPHQ